MNEKIVTSQAELDAIPVDYSGRIIIKFGTPAKRAVVNKKYLLPVEAYDNSSVCAYGNSQVVDAHRSGNIKVSGNARIVYNPDNITDWASANGITITDGKADCIRPYINAMANTLPIGMKILYTPSARSPRQTGSPPTPRKIAGREYTWRRRFGLFALVVHGAN